MGLLRHIPWTWLPILIFFLYNVLYMLKAENIVEVSNNLKSMGQQTGIRAKVATNSEIPGNDFDPFPRNKRQSINWERSKLNDLHGTYACKVPCNKVGLTSGLGSHSVNPKVHNLVASSGSTVPSWRELRPQYGRSAIGTYCRPLKRYGTKSYCFADHCYWSHKLHPEKYQDLCSWHKLHYGGWGGVYYNHSCDYECSIDTHPHDVHPAYCCSDASSGRDVFDCSCANMYWPVCGTNGVTYDNKCLLDCAGVPFAGFVFQDDGTELVCEQITDYTYVDE